MQKRPADRHIDNAWPETGIVFSRSSSGASALWSSFADHVANNGEKNIYAIGRRDQIDR